MCFSSHRTWATPSDRNPANARTECSSTSGSGEVAVGAIGGGYGSQRGSTANRPITSGAAAACSALTVTRPW